MDVQQLEITVCSTICILYSIAVVNVAGEITCVLSNGTRVITNNWKINKDERSSSYTEQTHYDCEDRWKLFRGCCQSAVQLQRSSWYVSNGQFIWKFCVWIKWKCVVRECLKHPFLMLLPLTLIDWWNLGSNIVYTSLARCIQILAHFVQYIWRWMMTSSFEKCLQYFWINLVSTGGYHKISINTLHTT